MAKGLLCWALKSITEVALRPLPPASSPSLLSPCIFPNEILAYFIPSQHLPLRPTLNSLRANWCSYVCAVVSGHPGLCPSILGAGVEWPQGEKKAERGPKDSFGHLTTFPWSSFFLGSSVPLEVHPGGQRGAGPGKRGCVPNISQTGGGGAAPCLALALLIFSLLLCAVSSFCILCC